MKRSPLGVGGRTYLITGGAGFIGSNFVGAVLGSEPCAKVRVLDRLSYSGTLASLTAFSGDPRFEFMEGDIRSREDVERAMEGVSVVVNFAAEVSVDRSLRDASTFLQTGVIGVHTLLEAARGSFSLQRFIQISTDEVYGTVPVDSCHEDSDVRPRNPYAAAKLSGEILARSYFDSFGVPVVITRASNTYGPQAHPEKVIPLFITNLIDGRQVPIFGDGQQVRDWLYVEDHCQAILCVLNSGEPGQVYNVGGGQERTNLEMTHLLLDLLHCDDSMIKFVQDRPGHDRRYSLDTSKLRALGWAPRYSLEEGLRKTVGWYLDNEAWWRPLKDALEGAYASGLWGTKS